MPGGRTAPEGDRWPLTGTTEETAADLRAYAEAGCDEIMLSWRAKTVDDLVARLVTFAQEAIPASGLRWPEMADQPPATAGMIDTVSPSGTGVSRPWR